MNPELLKTIHYSTEIVFPPITNLEKNTLVDIYSKICQTFEYPSFSLIPNGAQLTHPNGSALRIMSDRLYIQEEDSQFNIQLFMDKTKTVMEHIRTEMNIPMFLFQAVVLRSLWPCDSGNSSRDILLNKFFSFTSEDINTLGKNLGGAGLRLNLPGKDEVMDIRIEPWFRDMNNLFIEIKGEFHGVVYNSSIPLERINRVYDFLFQDISKFVIER